MSEVKWELVSDIRRVEANNAKLTKQLAGLKEQMRQLKTESVAATDTWTRGVERLKAQNDKWAQGMARLREQTATVQTSMVRMGASGADASMAIAGKLGAVVAGLVTVRSVADMVVGSYKRWLSVMEAAGQRNAALSQDIVRTLVASGDVAQGARIETALSSIPGATREQGTQAFAGVTGAAPLSGLDRRLAVSREAARQAPTGVDLSQFGGLAGSVSELFPTREAGDIADVSVAVRSMAGKNIDRLQGDKFQRAMKGLIASGATPEHAMAMAISAVNENIQPETILEAEAGRRLGKRLTREERMHMARITPEAVAAREQGLIAAQREDAAEATLRSLGGFAAGRGAQTAQRTAEIESAIGPAEEVSTRIRSRMRARGAEQGPIQFARAEGIIGAEFFGSGVPGLGNAANAFGSQQERLISSGQRAGILSSEDVKELRADLRANTEAIRQANQQRGARNVDQHTE